MPEKLTLKFDPNTIEHLGVSLYSKLPSVLSELLSNSWDADADKVSIKFYDNGENKEIIYEDDGNGMDFDELNEKFLLIGRNRRKSPEDRISKKHRKVIGKKGLGKLSVFGICNSIEILSIKDGKKNHFKMNLEDIKNSEGEYNPELLCVKNAETSDENGTKLILRSIRRKSGFDIGEISVSLSKKFLIFDTLKTNLILNDSDEKNCN